MAYGVSFNINDDLSLSYGVHESDKVFMGATTIANDNSSIQLAYTMGGASLKIAETSVDNQAYSTATDKDVEGHTIALSLAF